MSPDRRGGRLDAMNIYELTPSATTFLADATERWGGHSPGPWFVLIPLTFWILVIAGIVYVVRTRRGRHGEDTLRDAYAKGEVTEADYRERLGVLRATKR
jgi:putative membrane protein